MFLRKVQFQLDKIEAHLENTSLPKLTNEHALSCEGILSEDEMFKGLKSMKSDKSVYTARLLERGPFSYFQILIFQLNKLQLLPFLSWSLPQRHFWIEDFHHASEVNVSSPSRFLWLDSRNPSNYSADYIIYGRSPYLNFDPQL